MGMLSCDDGAGPVVEQGQLHELKRCAVCQLGLWFALVELTCS